MAGGSRVQPNPFPLCKVLVQELFLATVCLVYLHSGFFPAVIMFGFAVSLWHRVRTEATAIVDATFKTLEEAKAERKKANPNAPYDV